MPPQILLIEDHPVMRETTIQFFERTLGVNCQAVATAEEAMQQMQNYQPDLVVIDINLPGMNGLDLLKELRLLYPNLSVLIMTGHGDQRYRQEAFDLGAKGFVFKHEGPAALSTEAKRLLADSAQQET